MTADIWNSNAGVQFWSDSSSWSSGSPPGSADDAEIHNGNPAIAPPQSGVTVKSLTIDNGATVIAAADGLTVTSDVSNSGTLSTSEATVAISGNFDNLGQLQIDINGFYDFANNTYYSPGDTTFTISGTLTNEFNSFVQIGSGNSSAGSTIVKVNAIANSGALIITGTPSVSTTLEITSTAAAGFGTTGEISGIEVQLEHNAVIQFDGGGQLTKIDSGTGLFLWFGAEINDKGVVGSNTALAGLTDIEGSLSLQDETLTTSTDLFIHNSQDGGSITSGVLDVDLAGTGGSTLTIGGNLIAHYAVQVGNAAISTATLVKAKEFDNSSLGQLSIHGGSFAPLSLISPATATVDIASKAGLGTEGILTGSVILDGHALLEFDGGGSIASVASGAALHLYGPHAFIADSSDITENSALSGLNDNAGTIDLDDITLTTTGGFTNDGSGGLTILQIDVNSTSVDGTTVRGGSDIDFNGTLTNSGANARIFIGSPNLTNGTLVKVKAVDNTGAIELDGGSPTDPTHLSANTLATLDIGSAAGFGTQGEVTGSVSLTGDALIEFDGGGGLTRIDSGASLGIEGQYTSIADTGGAADSALKDLAANAGLLQLTDHSLTLNGGLDNTGYLYVDNLSFINSDGQVISGGSDLAINGAFANENYFYAGNGIMSTAALITAESLDNTGTITLSGNQPPPSSGTTAYDTTLSVGGTSENDGTITLNAGGVLKISGGTFTEEHGSSMSGNGELSNAGTFILGDGTSVGVADIVNNGTVEVTTGSAEIGTSSGVISGTGTLLVGSGTTLEIEGGVGSGEMLQFETDANIAEIDNLLDGSNNQLFNAEIANWGSDDTIEFAQNGLGTFGDITDATVGSYDSNPGLTSVLLKDGGSTVATLELKGNYTGWIFDVTQPAATPGYVSIDAVACYCRGTLIRTVTGDRNVEDLAIGDRVVTVSGAVRPIKWIGTRSYGGLFIVGRKDMLPICFKAGSLGDGLPRRDLFISPHHAMYLDGMLIEAKDLVNGISIVQVVDVDRVDYFHVELDSHDVILAEGAWSETFVDDDSRAMFHNAHEYRMLYPEDVAGSARYCAPRLETGYELEAVRRRLAQRAGSTSSAPLAALRGHVDAVNADAIVGWAQDGAHPEVPLCLDIYSEGRLVGQTLANLYREDLKDAGLGSGRHAFAFTAPNGVMLSPATVEVRRALDGAILLRSISSQIAPAMEVAA